MHHIPLVYLTDQYCRESASDDILSPPRPCSRKENSLSIADWTQAWPRFLALVAIHLPQEYDTWKTHFERIRDAKDIALDWELWLAYDIEVRRCSCHHPLDPAIFHSAIWNDLRAKYRPQVVPPQKKPEIRKHKSVADLQEARARVKKQLEEVVIMSRKMKPLLQTTHPIS
ncbi:hypothetical protein M422DRAFT_35797 [Sphaerobolus stellatus SS14]|uniref:Uncharacterized protein n=1 Tax=Sphaerobolus stellatus (strain SS14) TaxID=990650 RepID=A0A0C9UTD6_SPHS4|nr:hypothetical protein M422DRAFT_35797 [Sphaerobolus stellatus SS14]